MKSLHNLKSLHHWIQLGCVILFMGVLWFGVPEPSFALGLNFGRSAQSAAVKQAPESSSGLCLNHENKIDLNNANIVAFQDCPGFYPQLATLIVQNSPYQDLNDVLNIEGLTEAQKEALQKNLDSFKLSEPITSLEMRMPPRPPMRSNP